MGEMPVTMESALKILQLEKSRSMPAPVVWLAIGAAPGIIRTLSLAASSNGIVFGSVEDDFYYYLVTADNFLRVGHLTFDGVNPTNGFHPLWFAIVTALCAVFHGSPRTVILLSHMVCTACVAVGSWGMMRFFIARRIDQPASILRACCLMFVALAFWISRGAMEVALAFALVPLLLESMSRIRSGGDMIKIGVLCMLASFARVDAVLLAWPLYLISGRVYLSNRGWLVAPRLLLSTLVGALPLGAYFWFNCRYFGGALPQSATAKALTMTRGPYPEIASVFRQPYLSFLIFVYVLVASWTLVRTRDLLFGTLAVWPLIFYGILAFRSPWPVWVWYLYPLVIVVPSLLEWVAASAHAGSKRTQTAMWILAVSFGIPVALNESRQIVLGRSSTPMVRAAFALERFGQDHPGRYAMGDRAGVVAFMLGRPLVQLEGLVGGTPVLDAIRSERPLLRFLDEQHVDYYIATDLKRRADGCWLCVEPAKAGREALTMRDALCRAPVYSFSETETRSGQAFKTLVFDVK